MSYNLLIVSYLLIICKAIQETHHDLNVNNYRKRFIANRRQNVLKNKRTNILDKYLFNNTVYLDGIIHYEINENNTKINKIESVEKQFKNILAMDGVKYTYKRGTKWRTWREISRNGGKKIICYVCEGIVQGNCTNCHTGGHWKIEENPPCPYEIFSIIKDNELCAKNYTQYKNDSDCPSKINFEDLGATCDNPIETKWRITRDYRNVKRFPASICKKEYCDITTVYTIDSQGISFRIINSSNVIFYSRVMRNGQKNYACVDDCGYYDPDTRKITAQQNPLTIDLLGNKKKREDVASTSLHKSKKISTKHKFKKHAYIKKKINKSMVKSAVIWPISEMNVESTTLSHCKKLEKTEQEDYEDEDSDYDY